MPRSKRDKKISLTKTSKKPALEFKQRIVDDVRSSVEKYEAVYLFLFYNLSNECLNNIRHTHWPGSRFIFGRKKLMQLGLGKTPDTEAGDNLHKMAMEVKGPRGLLFTDKPFEEVTSWFRQHKQQCIAQAGTKAIRTVHLKAGPMNISVAVEPYVRKLGLNTEHKNGQITLLQDHVLCTEGEIITANDAKILRVLGELVGTFRMDLESWWSKKDGSYTKLRKKPEYKSKDISSTSLGQEL